MDTRSYTDTEPTSQSRVQFLEDVEAYYDLPLPQGVWHQIHYVANYSAHHPDRDWVDPTGYYLHLFQAYPDIIQLVKLTLGGGQ